MLKYFFDFVENFDIFKSISDSENLPQMAPYSIRVQFRSLTGVPAGSGEIRAVKNAFFICVFKTSKRWMTKPSKGAAGSWYRHIPTELRFLRHFKGV